MICEIKQTLMKTLKRLLIAFAAVIASGSAASAQYYQMTNQTVNMISSIFNSGANYRGFFDVGFTRGIGTYEANVLEFTTTQGAQFTNWFYMGLGAGVDVLFTKEADNFNPAAFTDRSFTSQGCMIPLYSDFRFTAGSPAKPSFFADLRIGAAFLIGKDYVQIDEAYISRSECFYLRPTVGVRIPVSKSNPKFAVNFGLSYQLITTEYWSNRNIALNSLGLSAGFEW